MAFFLTHRYAGRHHPARQMQRVGGPGGSMCGEEERRSVDRGGEAGGGAIESGGRRPSEAAREEGGGRAHAQWSRGSIAAAHGEAGGGVRWRRACGGCRSGGEKQREGEVARGRRRAQRRRVRERLARRRRAQRRRGIRGATATARGRSRGVGLAGREAGDREMEGRRREKKKIEKG